MLIFIPPHFEYLTPEVFLGSKFVVFFLPEEEILYLKPPKNENPCDITSLFCLVQVILSLYRPIVFANYSLEGAGVSRTAAVYSKDSLLFVAGNKVHFVITTAGASFLLKG